jgi:hypothetical protein
VERHGAEGVGQRLLVPACTEPGRRVEARCGNEGLQTLLSSGHEARVHNHVPLPQVAIGRPWCIGPVIGTSGGGGLARRATTTSTTVVVLAVVATAIISIVVFVVVLVPVATGATIFAIGRAR